MYLLSFKGVQDGEVPIVLQGENDDLPRVVKAWGSRHIQAAILS